jgi:hypothetical protein
MILILTSFQRFGTIPLENPQLFYFQREIAHVVSREATFGRDNRIGYSVERAP